MSSPPANANGHRRRQLRAQVLAEETHCALCGKLVDKNLGFLDGQHSPRCTRTDCGGCIPHPDRAEVDEIIPRSRGGNPLDRANTTLVCRRCNQIKGDRSFEWAQAEIARRRSSDPGRLVAGGSTTTTLVDW